MATTFLTPTRRSWASLSKGLVPEGFLGVGRGASQPARVFSYGNSLQSVGLFDTGNRMLFNLFRTPWQVHPCSIVKAGRRSQQVSRGWYKHPRSFQSTHLGDQQLPVESNVGVPNRDSAHTGRTACSFTNYGMVHNKQIPSQPPSASPVAKHRALGIVAVTLLTQERP